MARVSEHEAVPPAQHLHTLLAGPVRPPLPTPAHHAPPHPRPCCPAAAWATGGEPDEPHWGLFTAYFSNDSDWLNTFIENDFDGSGDFTSEGARAQVGVAAAAAPPLGLPAGTAP